MGFGVNWESIHTDTAPQLLRINIARLTQHVVEAKAKELLCRYINAPLEAGAKQVTHVELRSRWFSDWRHEYGLSLRRPNIGDTSLGKPCSRRGWR